MNFRQYFEELFPAYALIAICVFGVVVLVTGWALVHFRAGRGHSPSLKTDHVKAEFAYIGLLLVIASGLAATAITFDSKETASLGRAALTVRITGFRWCWRFQYLHTPVNIVGNCNPTVPTLVLPKGEVVDVQLTSSDVIHEWYVPEFRWKEEAFPDHINYFQLRSDTTGDWFGECTVFCGLFHYRMHFYVKVVPRAQFASFMHAHGAIGAIAAL